MIKSALQSSLTNDVKYRNLAGSNLPSNEYLIETVIVGATPAASITFSNLAQWAGVYRHLQLVGSARTTANTTIRMSLIQFNGDTANNYAIHMLLGDSNAAAPYTSAQSGRSSVLGFYGNGAGNTAGAFGSGVVDILDAFSTSKNKVTKSLGGQTGYSILSLNSGLWISTSPITSITISNDAGDSFGQGTRFSLYGVTA